MDFEERQAVRRRRLNINISIPMSLIEVLDRLTDATGALSTSVTCERLIRQGIEIERQAWAKREQVKG